MSKVRDVFLVEDHPVFRFGLRELIDQEDDLKVSGEAEDVPEALEHLATSIPDIMLVDLSLKDSSGIDLIKTLRTLYPDLPVLVVSMYDEALYAERALAAGARGYIMKQEASGLIVQAVRKVLEGEIYLSEKMVTEIIGKAVAGGRPGEDILVDKLTTRELEVFKLIGNGLTTGEIANKLNLSAKTIGTHRERMKEKLKLKTAAELTLRAVRWSEQE